jgi:hypothetical protein
MSSIKRTVYAAMCLALSVVLPLAFHSIPNAGSVLLPMHLPVLLCGLVCGWPYGLACGALAPVLSSVITGMPPIAYVPAMVCELAVYGLVSGLLNRYVRTGKLFGDIYISLVSAMLAGRVVGGILNALIFSVGKYSMPVWVTGYFVTALPGIIILLVLVPVIVFALEKAKLIEIRYPRPENKSVAAE